MLLKMHGMNGKLQCLKVQDASIVLAITIQQGITFASSSKLRLWDLCITCTDSFIVVIITVKH